MLSAINFFHLGFGEVEVAIMFKIAVRSGIGKDLTSVALLLTPNPSHHPTHKKEEDPGILE